MIVQSCLLAQALQEGCYTLVKLSGASEPLLRKGYYSAVASGPSDEPLAIATDLATAVGLCDRYRLGFNPLWLTTCARIELSASIVYRCCFYVVICCCGTVLSAAAVVAATTIE